MKQAFGDLELERADEAFVHRHAFVDEEPQRVERGGARDRERRVEVARVDACGTREGDAERRLARDRRDVGARGDRGAVVEMHGCGARRGSDARDRALERRRRAVELALAARCERVAKFARDSRDLRDAVARRRELRLEVREIFVGISRRIRPAREARAADGRVERSGAHGMERFEHDALFRERRRVGRKRARPCAADLGVVRAHGHERDAGAVDEHGRDGRHIGQMRAAERGVVGDGDVAVGEFERAHDRARADAERAEVDGEMRGVLDERAVRVEHRAGEVEAVADVRAERRALEDMTHRERDRFEPCGEQFLLGGVGAGAWRIGARRDEIA